MSRKILFVILSLVIVQASMAQGLRVGVKGGVNVNKIAGKSFEQEFSYGYHAGGFLEIGLSKRIGIQPEVLFSQYSTTVDSNFKSLYSSLFNPAYTKNVKLNYLSIPVLLNYKMGFITLQAGPQFGILIDKRENLIQNGQTAFSKGDFAMTGGVQLNLSKLRLQGRYLVGLNNINDIDNKDKWKSQAFQLSLGLAL